MTSTTETRLRETEGQETEERAALLARVGRWQEAADLYRSLGWDELHASANERGTYAARKAECDRLWLLANECEQQVAKDALARFDAKSAEIRNRKGA